LRPRRATYPSKKKRNGSHNGGNLKGNSSAGDRRHLRRLPSKLKKRIRRRKRKKERRIFSIISPKTEIGTKRGTPPGKRRVSS